MERDPRLQLIPVPDVHPILLVPLALVNFCIPGVGLMVGACIAGDPYFLHEFYTGLSYLWWSFLVVGIVLSWADGVRMLYEACKRDNWARHNARCCVRRKQNFDGEHNRI